MKYKDYAFLKIREKLCQELQQEPVELRMMEKKVLR